MTKKKLTRGINLNKVVKNDFHSSMTTDVNFVRTVFLFVRCSLSNCQRCYSVRRLFATTFHLTEAPADRSIWLSGLVAFGREYTFSQAGIESCRAVRAMSRDTRFLYTEATSNKFTKTVFSHIAIICETFTHSICSYKLDMSRVSSKRRTDFPYSVISLKLGGTGGETFGT